MKRQRSVETEIIRYAHLFAFRGFLFIIYLL